MKKNLSLIISLFTLFSLFSQKNSIIKNKFENKKTISQNCCNSKSNIIEQNFETGLSDGWLVVDSDGDGFQWDTISTFRTHSGNYCITSASWVDIDTGAVFPSNWLISPLIHLEANKKYALQYWVGAQDIIFPNENYKVLISPKGQTDTTFFSISYFQEIISNGEPENNNYLRRVFNISNFADSTFRIAWVHTNVTNQYYLNLDDISIYELPNYDAEIVYLKTSNSNCGLSNNEPVKIKIRNNGVLPIYNFSVSFKQNSTGTIVNEIIIDTIPSLEEYFYIFNSGADFSTIGSTDSLRTWITLNNDENLDNDTTKWLVVKNIAPINSPYSMGFEISDNLSGWTIDDKNYDGSTWQFVSDTSHSHTGKGFAAYNYNVANGAQDWLISRCIDLTPGVYGLKYFFKASHQNYPEKFKVAYGNYNNGDSLTNILFESNNVINTEYQGANIPITITTAGTYYFGFNCFSDADSWTLFLDDISIDVYNNISETKNDAKINIYPNPANENLHINSTEHIKSIKIYNIQSQLIYSVSANSSSISINTSEFESGIYFIKIDTNEGIINKKINIIR